MRHSAVPPARCALRYALTALRTVRSFEIRNWAFNIRYFLRMDMAVSCLPKEQANDRPTEQSNAFIVSHICIWFASKTVPRTFSRLASDL
jgi:hypothetical protein